MSPPVLSDADVVARYDRYVIEFLEALNICPYAKRAREGGTLRRHVLRGSPVDTAACVAALKKLTDGPREDFEVGVLILPDVTLNASEFTRFVSSARQVFSRESIPPSEYFLVAMHPEHVKDLSTPDRAVAFMRRTPHPSIQVARASAIYAARGTPNPGGESTSDVVARLGLQAVKDLGEAEAEALLNAIRNGF